jgi:hypothetical protein
MLGENMETFGSKRLIFEIGDKEFELIKFIKPRTVLCWSNEKISNGLREQVCGGIDASRIDIDTLKAIDVWGQIPDNIQKDIEYTKNNYKTEKIEKMQAGRRKKYEGMGIPREITCSKCGEPYKVIPCLFLKKYDKVKLEKTMAEYISTWLCKVCNPTKRGRQANPEFANLPKTMKCKCGREVSTNAYQLKVRAKKNNTTIQELIKNFVCQGCCCTKGYKKGHKGKRGKK